MMKKPMVLVGSLALAAMLGGAPVFAQTRMDVTVVPGENWIHKIKAGPFSLKKPPQLAVWIEDADGNFVSTLTVTGSAAKNKWMSAPDEGRPEALPVWRHASALPAGTVDAASSATVKGTVAVGKTASGLVSGKEYVAFLEVNASFDYNDTWPESAKEGDAGFSGVNGQPSLVYAGRFVAGTPSTVVLVPYGTGSVDGSDGRIVSGTEGLTTALSIVKSAEIAVK